MIEPTVLEWAARLAQRARQAQAERKLLEIEPADAGTLANFIDEAMEAAEAELLRLARETSEGQVPFQEVINQYERLFGEELTRELAKQGRLTHTRGTKDIQHEKGPFRSS